MPGSQNTKKKKKKKKMGGIKVLVFKFQTQFSWAAEGLGRGKAMVGRCTNYGCSPLIQKQPSIIREQTLDIWRKTSYLPLGSLKHSCKVQLELMQVG